MLDQFSSWNPEINAGLNNASKETLNLERAKNMIFSNDYKLVRAGASRIFHQHFEEPIYTDLAYERLKGIYLTVKPVDPEADAAAWLAKVLGKSKNKDYGEFLLEIEKDASSRHLRKWATRAYEIKTRLKKLRTGVKKGDHSIAFFLTQQLRFSHKLETYYIPPRLFLLPQRSLFPTYRFQGTPIRHTSNGSARYIQPHQTPAL